VTVSQYAFLCTATHDYEDPDFSLIMKPIDVGDYAWIGARAFVGPGVSIGEGAVVGATASVYRDVPEWTVVGGNPAKVIKQRIMKGTRQRAVVSEQWTQNPTPETCHLTPETIL
jgi:putative colanic acid biosynthesis acetyltransferase WcaF